MYTDIQFQSEGWMFNCRVAGVCVKNGSVFLSRLISDPCWTFIGGKPALGEDTEQAVLREYEEETGARLQVDRLLALIENFFELNGKPWHQYLFVYLLKDEENALEEFHGQRQIADNKQGVYRWFKLEEIKSVPIRPVCFYPLLESLPTEVLHIINHEL